MLVLELVLPVCRQTVGKADPSPYTRIPRRLLQTRRALDHGRRRRDRREQGPMGGGALWQCCRALRCQAHQSAGCGCHRAPTLPCCRTLLQTTPPLTLILWPFTFGSTTGEPGLLGPGCGCLGGDCLGWRSGREAPGASQLLTSSYGHACPCKLQGGQEPPVCAALDHAAHRRCTGAQLLF